MLKDYLNSLEFICEVELKTTPIFTSPRSISQFLVSWVRWKIRVHLDKDLWTVNTPGTTMDLHPPKNLIMLYFINTLHIRLLETGGEMQCITHSFSGRDSITHFAGNSHGSDLKLIRADLYTLGVMHCVRVSLHHVP